MKRLKAYRELLIVITCTFVFLGLNSHYGDVFGFKAFLSDEQKIINTRLILSSRFIPVLEGHKAVISKPLHYFIGTVTKVNSTVYLEDGTISVPVDKEKLYQVFVDLKVVYLVSTLAIVILLRSLYVRSKEKKIKTLK